MLKQAVHKFGRWYINLAVKLEAAQQTSRPINERPTEVAFLMNAIREYRPGRILDVGSGQSPLPALLRNCGCSVLAVDNIKDYWPSGMINRHWPVENVDIRNPTPLSGFSFDMISCVSVIEHRPEIAFASMINLLRPGGQLVLTMPYNETRFAEDVYKLPDFQGEAQPYKCSSYDRATVNSWLCDRPAKIVGEELWRYWSGDVWQQGERVFPKLADARSPHQLGCFVIRRCS